MAMKRGLAAALALALGSFCLGSEAIADTHATDLTGSLQPVGSTGGGRSTLPVGRYKPPTGPIYAPKVVNSHVVHLNRCANGCQVTSNGAGGGNPTDSTVRPIRSDIAGQCVQGGQGGTFTLTKFSDGDAAWNQVVSCMKTIMAPYNITVTEDDPGSAPHFEVLIGGNPGDIGCDNNTAGIADGLCSSTGNCVADYYPNAVVYSFSNVWQGDTNTICGTAAQEIAHAWNLDHTIDASDPMTYKNYTSSLSYKNGEKCGSDCVNGRGPLGEACTGTGLTGTHLCNQNGLATQDEVDKINGLFGAGNGVPPTVAIFSPANNANVPVGFSIKATCTTNDGTPITEVQFAIDGAGIGSVTTAPYAQVVPGSYTTGTHTLTATCVVGSGASAVATATATISATGGMCKADSDCPNATDACVNGACVVGPDGNGGLGLVCGGDADCAQGRCLSDNTTNHCVVACDMTASSACPGGFDCISDGGGGGVCWPNGESGGGGGGCDAGGTSPIAPLVIGLGFAALLFTRRRS